jgi:peptidyl-prolyl cis-trans isomerase C
MRHILALFTATFLSTAALADDYIVLKVNDDAISSQAVQKNWQQLFPEASAPSFDTVNPAIRQNVLRGMVSERLLYTEAQKQGIENSPELKEALEEAKRKLVIRQFLQKRSGELVNEEALKAEYQKLAEAQQGKTEIRARHILLESKKDAKDMAKRLEAGEKFQALAREFSKDPGSAGQGGDLGYFTEGTMVKEFSDAAFALKKGEVSKPVKSPFGWHIILLEDSRAASLAPFNEMRDELKQKVQEQALNSYVQQLIENAKITYFDAKGNELPFDKNPKAIDEVEQQ